MQQIVADALVTPNALLAINKFGYERCCAEQFFLWGSRLHSIQTRFLYLFYPAMDWKIESTVEEHTKSA